MAKNELKNIKAHLTQVLDDRMCAHADIEEGDVETHLCVLRVLVGYDEALTERDLALGALKKIVDSIQKLPPLITIEEILREDLLYAQSAIKLIERS